MSFIKSVYEDNNKITLTKFNGSSMPTYGGDSYNKEIFKIALLDIETTGLNKQSDQIIELAIKVVAVQKLTGELLGVIDSYESFNDPGQPISESAMRVNKITNEMVAGYKIDWSIAESLFQVSDIIVAHNAQFDRGFIDQKLPVSRSKVWACSMKDIDWFERGFTNNKQELLCIWHGFFFESHRAMGDVNALIHLLSHPSYESNQFPCGDLIQNAFIPVYKISATNSAFETKDILKANGYKWDSELRVWWMTIKREEIKNEKEWLTENVYHGHFMGIVEEIQPIDKHK